MLLRKHIHLHAIWMFACISVMGVHAEEKKAPSDTVRAIFSQFYKAIPKTDAPSDKDAKLIDLGRRLFFERALSPSRTRSCNDCHDLSKYGTNGVAAIKAQRDGKLRRDVPSVYNIATLELLGWTGIKADLRSYTRIALTHEEQSNLGDDESVVKQLTTLGTYGERFKTAFGDDKITIDRVLDALAIFQKGLLTRAPFDDFLLGDNKALSADQLKGALLFDKRNCSACHTGPTMGGQMLQKAGVVHPWPNQKDKGYFEVSKNPAHKMVFRVPPLRNVSETAPYFHDRTGRSLRRAIYLITIHEQGMYLASDEIVLIEAFLKSFTGKLPTRYIQSPFKSKPSAPLE